MTSNQDIRSIWLLLEAARMHSVRDAHRAFDENRVVMFGRSVHASAVLARLARKLAPRKPTTPLRLGRR